jgi:hypothetical protein
MKLWLFSLTVWFALTATAQTTNQALHRDRGQIPIVFLIGVRYQLFNFIKQLVSDPDYYQGLPNPPKLAKYLTLARSSQSYFCTFNA